MFFFPFFSVSFSLFLLCCCAVLCFLFHQEEKAVCRSALHTASMSKEQNDYPTSGMYVRTAYERAWRATYVRQPPAKRIWRPSCFLLKRGGGTIGILKSPVCNYYCTIDHGKNYHGIFNHGPLSALHNNLVYFSFLSERSGRRRPPAERSAL